MKKTRKRDTIKKNTNNFPETDPQEMEICELSKNYSNNYFKEIQQDSKEHKKLNELSKQYMNKTGVQQSNVNHKKNQIEILKLKNKMY